MERLHPSMKQNHGLSVNSLLNTLRFTAHKDLSHIRSILHYTVDLMPTWGTEYD